jgi:RNA polymerase sigma-70 factor (ECF subfamily)
MCLSREQKERALQSQDSSDVNSCLAGDQAAYARLVARHQADVAKRMMRFTRDRHECEELVQTVFVQAYCALRSYRGEGPFLHWLGIICTRVGYDFWSRKERIGETADLDRLTNEGLSSPDSPTPTEAAEIAHALLARLPTPDRLILTLLHLEDCSIGEIAERTGWSRAVVKMRAYRARRRIKAIAEQENLLEKLGWIR